MLLRGRLRPRLAHGDRTPRLRLLQQRHPASIRLCTLLDKPDRRKVQVDVHYSGFTIPDAFVVGYGLDYAELYRNLPYIGVLKPEVYS